MTHKYHFWLLAVLFLGLIPSTYALGQEIKIKGVIVAYIPPDSSDAGLGSQQILLIKVNKVLRGKEKSKYVIACLYFDHNKYIDPKKFDGKSNWNFNLIQNEPSPNIVFRDVLYSQLWDAETGKVIKKFVCMIFLVNPELIKKIGEDTILPTYHFFNGDFKICSKSE